MKAVVLEQPGVMTYRDVADPEPVGERSALLRIGAVGVCGSDVLRFGKGKAYHYPLVLGHEFSATVHEAPSGSKFSAGDRVAVFPLIPNPADPMTKVGEYALSSGYDYFGSRRDGGMCEYLYVPESNLIPIPRHLPLVHAAAVEPAAVALHAMLKLDVPARATALVIGAGPIGGLAAQWLKVRGCSHVYVADIDQAKRDVMSELGFEVINAAAADTVATVKTLTDGRGVDIAVEASGSPATFVQAVAAAAAFGQVMMLGDLSGDVTLPQPLLSSILRRELRLYGTWNSKITPAGQSEWEMVVDHLGTDVQIAPLISHTLPLDSAPAMFAAMNDRTAWYNKVVFAVSDDAREELGS